MLTCLDDLSRPNKNLTQTSRTPNPSKRRQDVWKSFGPAPSAGSAGEVHPLANLVPKHPFLHPAHGEQVVTGCEEPIPHAVMTATGIPGVVDDRNLGDCIALQLDQRRKKPMH